MVFGNPKAWAMWAGITATGAVVGEVAFKKAHPIAGALVAGLPALVVLGYLSAWGNPMFQLGVSPTATPAPLPATTVTK